MVYWNGRLPAWQLRLRFSQVAQRKEAKEAAKHGHALQLLLLLLLLSLQAQRKLDEARDAAKRRKEKAKERLASAAAAAERKAGKKAARKEGELAVWLCRALKQLSAVLQQLPAPMMYTQRQFHLPFLPIFDVCELISTDPSCLRLLTALSWSATWLTHHHNISPPSPPPTPMLLYCSRGCRRQCCQQPMGQQATAAAAAGRTSRRGRCRCCRC
jgi:multidrug efflux pump subunit AcrA (membrane-fusion protein)